MNGLLHTTLCKECWSKYILSQVQPVYEARQDKAVEEARQEERNKSCDICRWKDACNLIGNFLNGNKVQYCSEWQALKTKKEAK